MSADVERPMPTTAPAIVAAAAYADGRRVADIAIVEAGTWARRDGHFVWIGLHEPDGELLRQVQQQFGLHDLAIEDAQKAHQRPKIEQYGDGLFVVARTAQLAEAGIAFGETHLFIGRGYVVSVRHGASVSYGPVRDRCESRPALLAHGQDYVLYAILDFVVDNYLPVIEAIETQVESLEDRVLARGLSRHRVETLYRLRRDLLRLRNVATPLVDVCRRLEHTELPVIDPAMRPLFRDVTDHVQRVDEAIRSLREVLAFAFEASVMIGQMQHTEITRKLAAWAAILAVPTALAGLCGFLYWRFRRAGWL